MNGFSKSIAFLIAALILALVEPKSSVDQAGMVHLCYKIMRPLAVIVSVAIFMSKSRYKFSCPSLICVFLFALWLPIDCFWIHSTTEVAPIVFAPLTILSIVVIVEDFVHDRPRELVCGLFSAYFLLGVVNFLTMVFHPEGLYTVGNTAGWETDANWFLGHKNSLTDYYVVLTFLSLLLPTKENLRKITSFLCLGMFAMAALIGGSGTGIVCCMVLVAAIFFRVQNFEWLNVRNIIFVYCIVFALLMLAPNLQIFEYITEQLGKDITFTGRTYIWEVCWRMWAESPYMGNGWLDPLVRADLVPDAVSAINAHNTIVELLFSYGLIGMLLWVSAFYFSFRRLYYARDSYAARCTCVALVCMLPLTLMEDAVCRSQLFVILAMSFHSKRLSGFLYSRNNN